MTDHYIQRRKPQRDLLAARAGSGGCRLPRRGRALLSGQGVDELYVAVAQVRDGANLEGGIPRLRQAIERLKPAQPEFYLELAKAYSKSGNSSEAVRWCEEALRIRPGFGPAQKELGAALIAAGDFTRAAETLRRLSGPSAQTNLGNAYLRLGRIDLAEQALRAHPDDPDANNLLGMIESARQQLRRGRAVLPQGARTANGPCRGASESRQPARRAPRLSPGRIPLPAGHRGQSRLRRGPLPLRPVAARDRRHRSRPARNRSGASVSSPASPKRIATWPTFWPRKAAPAKRPPSTGSRRRARHANDIRRVRLSINAAAVQPVRAPPAGASGTHRTSGRPAFPSGRPRIPVTSAGSRGRL